MEIIIHLSEEIIKGKIGKGSKIAISTSKIKKIIAIIKNRKEKGIRDVENGENPHSKGEVFSRSRLVFFLKIVAVIIIAKAIKKTNVKISIRINIFSSDEQIFSLEVRYNFYTKEKRSPSINCDE
jgi:hypothetical protein